VIAKILSIGSREKYALVTDFAWYLSVLFALAAMSGTAHGIQVADQIIDVALRVESVRPFAVEGSLSLLFDEQLLSGSAKSVVAEVLRAAAFVLGEYSSVLTLISKDRADDLDEEDEEDEDVFWIDGVGGEEQRSLFRGQSLLVMVLEQLMHPQVTVLPFPVQRVFLQAALKCFIRATRDCDAVELCKAIAALRGGLPLFLQSRDLEVQERSNTLRCLLAELDILPLHWEEGLEKEETKDSAIEDLLCSFSPAGLKEVDEAGAQAAKRQQRLLQAMVSESFCAVHAKAQRKVPLPSGLDLEEVSHPSALDKLLHLEIPQNLSIQKLRLLPDSNSIRSMDEEKFEIQSVQSYHSEKKSVSDQTTVATSTSSSTGNSTARPLSEEASVFMLGSRLSKVLGEGIDEVQDFKYPSAANTNTKHKKKSKQKVTAVDRSDVLPAGAGLDYSSEEERRKEKRSSRRSSNTNSTKRKVLDGDEDDDDVSLYRLLLNIHMIYRINTCVLV
jgi:hypothetical protein